MRLLLENYKFLRIKKHLKKNKLLVLYNINDSGSKVWFKIAEKLLKNLKIKSCKLQDKFMTNIIDRSIYKRFKFLINGPVLFGIFKGTTNEVFSTFFTIESVLTIFGIKLNKTFYLLGQIKIVKILEYRKAILNLKEFLRTKVGLHYFEIM
jgi:hypothetical protein